MKKVGRTLAAAATTIGLALVAAGCSSNVIGADGPRPGVAAQVEDAEITLDDLTEATDGLCTLQEGDPNASATSREYARNQILQAWVSSLVTAEYADDQGLDVSAPDPGLELAPGWDDVDEGDVDALRDYVEAFVFSSAVQEAAGADAEAPDPADYDITINPRFDVVFDGSAFVPAGEQLSVPVSDEAALTTEAPTPDQIADLSDDELCGKRPAPETAPPIPMG